MEDWEQILKDMQEARDKNFLAIGISHWHALGISAALFEIKKREKECKGAIILAPHPKDGLLLKTEDFYLNGSDVTFYFLSNGRSLWQIIRAFVELIKGWINLVLYSCSRRKQDRRSFYIISPLSIEIEAIRLFENRCFAKKFYPQFIVIDEGVGSYFSKSVWDQVHSLDESTKSIVKKELLRLKEVVQSLTKFLFRAEERFLFKVKEGELVPNPEVVNNYLHVLSSEFGENQENDSIATALLITQPFSEYRQLSIDREKELIGRMVAYLIRKGFRVCIKPHPRERSEKYNEILTELGLKSAIQVLPQNYPIERDYAAFKSKKTIVVGYTSTALLTAAVLYGLPAYSAVDLLLNETCGELIRESCLIFRRLTRRLIKRFPVEEVMLQ